MIWNDVLLERWARQGGVKPFEPSFINPASIDLAWSGRWRWYMPEFVLDFDEDGHVKPGVKSGWSDVMEGEQVVLHHNIFYLLDSLEYIRMPLSAAGILYMKSSMGRKGLEHSHAGFVDPGFEGTLTWEISILCPNDIILKRGQPVMQLVLEQCHLPRKPYIETGRYNGQRVPTEAIA